MTREQSTDEGSGGVPHEPTFWEVVVDAVRHSWEDEGLSGKLTVGLLVVLVTALVAGAIYGAVGVVL